MNKFLTALAVAAVVIPSLAQEKPIPQLSTADRTALSAMEVKKQEAQKTFNDAQQVELSILKEFEVSHPGFMVNPQTFAVEKVKPKAKAAEEKPAEKPAEPEKK